ncbi:hypothetical protein A3A09_02225 [Candidatus Nomurabacteria bacterium RIFCSPLOWO2_01_FULL_42_20]|uniref:Probable endolytic peptidoglycan transglycosylase RlpA n=1 Tax=Candidatus Nomurabacteria bacterium RIFCSPHIGHO2_01_FULL_42_16 TaxID=1801743 RepID=A0A1F6VHN6_9BACT|nr:MAG: hypothetical protein A2824_01945 [Candidatus Nomurabacteria bacterium RIFCSPHIGHO2_01_FULL_42_16]OGI92135.1 MAG: hypothetical protein A3A09_02225 [Candidatus Nomurabacteria bacterium RIFCSPLOWO2_01_FULL_42_20]
MLTGILKKSFKVVETRSGRASYYSDFFQNRPTASGEIFDNYEYTAAHLDLPFNTKARITNPRNGRSVVIKINDRGPFIPGRIIDLSRIAARDLGLLQAGVGQVEIQILKPEID